MLNKEKATELQEKLIILYKYITQKSLFDDFFMVDSGNQKEIKNPIVKEIIELEDNRQFLRDCIMELEDKKPMNMDRDYNGESFDYIVNTKTVEYLSKKYGLKDSNDVDALDLEYLLELI